MSVRKRVLIGTAATVLAVAPAAAWFGLSSPDHVATEVQLEDTAGVIYEPDLRAGLEEIRFQEPTTVAVFTHRGGREALTDDYALNNAVLEHARQSRPDWLSDDEQKWADDLFIFGVDPEGRLVGTYFGENRAVSEEQQLEIQDAAGDDFRRGQWTVGTVAGIDAAADRMNSAVIRRPAGLAVAGAVGFGTLLGSGIYIGTGMHRARRSREARANGDRGMANVVRDYELTEVHAHLIPEDSQYGGAMLGRYADYTKGFRELTELGNRARDIPESDYDSKQARDTLLAYEEKATSLDELDDVIADTATLLNLDSTWPEAWERQVGTLRADLEQAAESFPSDLPEELRGDPEALAVREFGSQGLADLEQLRGDLERGVVSPDDALDLLRATRDELTAHAERLAGAVAKAYTSDHSEQGTIEHSVRMQRRDRTSEATILSTTDPLWTWLTLDAVGTGYSQGTSRVESARSSSSSGGSTSGYSSGGSFSGAGSSSRF